MSSSEAVSTAIEADAQSSAERSIPRETQRLGPAGAQLAGWLGVAAVNQGMIAIRVPDAALSTRVLHHVYDVGHFVALGVVSFLAVTLASAALRRQKLVRQRLSAAALTAVACFAVGIFTVRGDVTNAAARYGMPLWLAVVGAAGAFAVLFGAIVWFIRNPRSRVLRGCAFVAGLAFAVLNAHVLPGDYIGFHWMLAWLSALLLACSLEGARAGWPTRVRPSLRPALRAALIVALGVFGAVTILKPPRQEVLRRLYSVSSSVVIPFVGRLYPEMPGPNLQQARREYLASPWFQSRDAHPPVPPTGALKPTSPPLVILITVDALRADVIAKREYADRLPGFAELRKRAAYFTQARSAASSTRPSLATVFTGRYYSQLEWAERKGTVHLVDPGPRLAELLSAAKVETFSFPQEPRISSRVGVGRGFATEVLKRSKAGPRADQLIELIGKVERPTFIYAHFTEPHAPYQGEGPPFERYVQEVERVDRELARIHQAIRDAGLERRTILIVTADHGEAFFEHGVGAHARILYEEVTRVPLLIVGPGVVAREIDEPVTLVDLTPTILDVFGLPAPGAFMGQSLAAVAAGAPARFERPIAAHATLGIAAFYLRDGIKVLFDSRRRVTEVYDLIRDPGEQRNLTESMEPRIRSAIETGRLFFHSHRTPPLDYDVAEAVPEEP